MTNRITVVKHGTVREGDRIRVDGGYGDMEIRREGVVARITSTGSTWEYTTKAGYTLFTVFRDGSTQPSRATLSLLARNVDTPLFDI
ncbi:hypothetical protein CF_18 [Curtobacterium phage Ayka]|nr:hypothetical protein CF_18 [Curtobacterium phage Ayka]